jgi:hypothetical protein
MCHPPRTTDGTKSTLFDSWCAYEGEREKDLDSVFPSSIIAGNLAEWGLKIGLIQFLDKISLVECGFLVRMDLLVAGFRTDHMSDGRNWCHEEETDTYRRITETVHVAIVYVERIQLHEC